MSSSERWVAVQPPLATAITAIRHRFTAFDHFARVFAIRPGERVLLLTDPLLDVRVVQAIRGLAEARGASVRQVVEPSSQLTEIPGAIRPLLEEADFVVSTWFCSILSPLCIARRAEGQRWVKITYFRDLDLLDTPAARFPPEIVGELIRATARRFPVNEAFELRFTDERGTDLRLGFTPRMRDHLLAGNRWRGKMFADEPGCYVHYLPTHGPNFWDRTAHDNDSEAPLALSGWLYPQGAVGFERPFSRPVGVRFSGDRVVEVAGEGQEAEILRECLVEGRLIELGCGFCPKAPRRTVYPAGSNAPGALHFGIDLPRPADWLRRKLPDWEEPPVHVDLVTLDTTVTAGGRDLVVGGRLCALDDEVVHERASRYGDPLDLLEELGS